MSRLSHSLVTLTELYEDYSLPLGLYESQLDIMHAAGGVDEVRVFEVWQSMLGSGERLPLLLQRVEAIGRRYSNSPVLFPLSMLTKELELAACRERCEPGLVARALLRCGVSATLLLDTYLKTLQQSDFAWLAAGNALHLCDMSEILVGDLLEQGLGAGEGRARREQLVQCSDLLTSSLTMVYTLTDQQHRLSRYRELQSRCERLLKAAA